MDCDASAQCSSQQPRLGAMMLATVVMMTMTKAVMTTVLLVLIEMKVVMVTFADTQNLMNL